MKNGDNCSVVVLLPFSIITISQGIDDNLCSLIMDSFKLTSFFVNLNKRIDLQFFQCVSVFLAFLSFTYFQQKVTKKLQCVFMMIELPIFQHIKTQRFTNHNESNQRANSALDSQRSSSS